MNKEKLSEEEGMRVIREMIAVSRHKLNDSGFHFLLWGVLVAAASLVQYALLMAGYGQASNWVWVIMPAIGVPMAIVYEVRRERREPVKTKFDAIYAAVWQGFGIALILIIVLSIMAQANPVPFLLVLIGLATFISGAVLRFMPLKVGAFVFWFTAVLSLWVPGEELLLLYAASVILGYVGPGLLLRKRFKAKVDV